MRGIAGLFYRQSPDEIEKMLQKIKLGAHCVKLWRGMFAFIFIQVNELFLERAALGICARTSLEWLKLDFDTDGMDLHKTIHTDYWRRGRTVEKLGLAEWSVSELTRYVNDGVLE